MSIAEIKSAQELDDSQLFDVICSKLKDETLTSLILKWEGQIAAHNPKEIEGWTKQLELSEEKYKIFSCWMSGLVGRLVFNIFSIFSKFEAVWVFEKKRV